MTVRQQILDELTAHGGWMTTTALVKVLKPANEETIHRALRELRWKARIISQTISGNKKSQKEWKLLTKKSTTTSIQPNNFTVLYGKPQYNGATLMNVPNGKPSLVKAVGDMVTQDFVANGTKFSAHDVTKKLREKVLTDDTLVDMGETGPCWVQGKQVAKIEHEDVRGIVHDLFSNGSLVGYGRSMNSSGFWEYDLLTNIAPVTIPDDDDDGTVAPTAVADGSTYDGSSTI